MRKLSENERRMMERLRLVSGDAFVPAYILPNGRRSDARARTVLSLLRLGLIEDEYGRLTVPVGSAASQHSGHTDYADRASIRLTPAGRAVSVSAATEGGEK